MAIQGQVAQRNTPGDELELCLQHRLNALHFRRQGDLGLGLVLRTFGASGLALGGGLLGGLGRSFGFGSSFLSLGAHDLLQAQRTSAARCGADERQAKERHPRHRLLQDTREEAVKAEGLLAGFGDDDLIAG
jgi:hypothetical protein